MAFATIGTTGIADDAVTSAKVAPGVVDTEAQPNQAPIWINGSMDVAQRATSATGKTAGGFYTVDRMQLDISGTIGTWTIAQESQTSGNAIDNGFANAYRIDCTSATASPASGAFLKVISSFEGQDLQMFKKGTSNAQKFTLAFWVKSNKTGTAQVNLRDMDNTRMIGASYSISSADTWEFKVCNFAADTTGKFDDDNARSLIVEWWLDGGSDYTSGAMPTAWEARNAADSMAAGSLDMAGSTDNDWAITAIQLEVGEFSSTTLPPFKHESYGDNLARCQRYFQMRADGNQKVIGIGNWGSGTQVDVTLEIPPMRTRPSIEYTTGSGYWTIAGGGGSDNTLDNLNMNSWSTDMNISLWTTTGAGGTAGYANHVYSSNASAKLGFTAEL